MAIPLLIAGGVAAASGAGLIGGGAASGVGKDSTRAPTFGETKDYDPNKYMYGGHAGGASEAANRYAGQAALAQGRGGPQADFAGAQPNYARANEWDAYAGQQAVNAGLARGGQQNVTDLMMGRATGAVPSIAGQQAAQDMRMVQQNAMHQQRAAMAQQGAQAASARGAAGVALAGQTAANNTANATSAIGNSAAMAGQNISGQAQVNAATERMQAEQAAMGAYSHMRGGDQSSQGLAYQGQQNAAQQTQFGAQLGSQQQQFNAGLRDSQAGRNDAMTQYMTGAEQNVQHAALQGGISQQQTLAGSQAQAASAHAAQGAANAQGQRDTLFKAVDLVKGGGGGGGGTPGRADGGPITKGHQYMVGEEGEEAVLHPGGRMDIVGRHGPEYIRARRNGYVIPAPQTAAMLAKGGRNGRANMGERDTQKMLDDRYVQETAGHVGEEVLRKPYTADEAAPWAGDVTDPAHGKGGRGVRYAATSDEQRAFEDKLTGKAPSREDSNAAEAAKIRRNFASNDATKQWERSNGPASKATAGVRGGSSGDEESTGSQLLRGFFGGRREEGGPVEADKDYLVGEAGPEAIVSRGPSPNPLPPPPPPPVNNDYAVREPPPRAPGPEGAVGLFAARRAAEPLVESDPSRGPTDAIGEALLQAAEKRRRDELVKAGQADPEPVDEPEKPARRMLSFVRDTPSDQARQKREFARAKKDDAKVAGGARKGTTALAKGGRK